MHGITCHAAVAFKSAAVKLSATLCAERVLSPVQQLIDAWQHTPCCIAASMSQFWPFSTGPLGRPLSAGVERMLLSSIDVPRDAAAVRAAIDLRRGTTHARHECRAHAATLWVAVEYCMASHATLQLHYRVPPLS